MKRGIVSALALSLALTGCSALPYAHEIDQTVLMEVLGVDAGPGEAVAITAASAGRGGTGESPGQDPLVLSAQAGTITAACAQMQTCGEQYVFYGDVEQVLVGEAAARRGLENLLGQMARDPNLRLEANLWVVKGGEAADPLLDAAGEGGAPGRLAALAQDAELLGGPLAKTAREVLAELLENGCALLPALERRAAEEGEGTQREDTLAAAGYAVLRDGALLAFTQGQETLGASLLLGWGHGGLLAFSDGAGGTVTLRLTGVRTTLEPSFDGGRLAGLTVTCRLETQAAEFQGWNSRLSETGRLALEEALEARAEGAMEEALALFQELDADCLRLGARAALAAPWRKDALEEQWAAAFPTLDIALEVEGRVARG